MLPIIAGIVSSLISNNLPKIAQAVVDKGVDYVENKLDVKIETEDTAEGIKIKQETIKELQLASIKHEEFQTEQDNINTADARDMQKEALRQDDTFSKRFVYYLASFWSAVTTVYIFCITFFSIPTTNIRFSDTILGFLLGSVIATLINYFFGSSNNSNKKTEALIKASVQDK